MCYNYIYNYDIICIYVVNPKWSPQSSTPLRCLQLLFLPLDLSQKSSTMDVNNPPKASESWIIVFKYLGFNRF